MRDPDGKLVAMIDRNGPEPDQYYLTDGLGSVMAIVSTTGTVRRYVYEPYGEQLRNFVDQDAASPNNSLDGTGSDPQDTEADFNPYRYASGYLDRSTGMLKFGTRYYMPTLTRWTQVDPVAGAPGNPMALNPYLYSADNPANVVDPSGRSILDDFIEGMAEAILTGAEAGYYWNKGEYARSSGIVIGYANGVATTAGCEILFLRGRVASIAFRRAARVAISCTAAGELAAEGTESFISSFG